MVVDTASEATHLTDNYANMKATAKILIVDDREENLLSLESILVDEGYEIVSANSGQEALRVLLKHTDFTLIIMDVVMPGLDGFQTAQYISEREKLKDIPIIFLTAKSIEENIFKAYKVGAVDYISKPVVADLLKAKVGVFTELSRKSQILEMQAKQLQEVNDDLEREVQFRKASEEKVTRLNLELEAKLEELESLDAFTHSVSHDLKTPLSSMAIITQLLNMDYGEQLDEEGAEMISKLENQIKRLNQLINDLLLFSRYGSEVQKEPTDMAQLVSEVLEDVKLSHAVNDKLEVKVGELPEVNCDPSLFRQVWVNLLSNAIKYSQKTDQPLVQVNAEPTDDGRYLFHVRDNGVGFDMKESHKLFKIFQRLGTSKGIEGTGVGLAIVKRIIDRHGGRIQVQSAPNEGTHFWFIV
jgi:signal transduction histidine kinase